MAQDQKSRTDPDRPPSDRPDEYQLPGAEDDAAPRKVGNRAGRARTADPQAPDQSEKGDQDIDTAETDADEAKGRLADRPRARDEGS